MSAFTRSRAQPSRRLRKSARSAAHSARISSFRTFAVASGPHQCLKSFSHWKPCFCYCWGLRNLHIFPFRGELWVRLGGKPSPRRQLILSYQYYHPLCWIALRCCFMDISAWTQILFFHRFNFSEALNTSWFNRCNFFTQRLTLHQNYFLRKSPLNTSSPLLFYKEIHGLMLYRRYFFKVTLPTSAGYPST